MQSRFIRLTEYCLVEYQFSGLGATDLIIDKDFIQVITPDGEIYLFNVTEETALGATGNTSDYTAVPVAKEGGRFVYLDPDNSPTYLEYNSDLITTTINSTYVQADRVRFHIASGFIFENFSNMLLSINQDMNDGNTISFANVIISPSTLTSLLKFNTRPLIIGNTPYDRYVDIIIPSIKNIDEEYYAENSITRVNTFAYKATSGTGLVRNNPITISLFECKTGPSIYGSSPDASYGLGRITCSKTSTSVVGVGTNFISQTKKDGFLYTEDGTVIGRVAAVNSPTSITLAQVASVNITTPSLFKIKQPFATYTTFDILQGYTSQVVQTNEFSGLGATIREATDGDYIEFFASYDSAFPEDFIGILRDRTSQNWIIFHQLTIYEQLSGNFEKQGEASFYQDSGFDSPLRYRPILDHANEAASMAIDYTIRLVNSVTNEQVIRNASLLVENPNKYGKSLLKLTLADLPESQRITNLIVKKASDSIKIYSEPLSPRALSKDKEVAAIRKAAEEEALLTTKTRTIVEYVPVFYTLDNILLSDVSRILTSDKKTTVAYGQGKLAISVTNFDNVYKFKVLQTKPDTTETFPFDLTGFSEFELIFGSGNSRISQINVKAQSQVDAKVGEILFKVDSVKSAKILELGDSKFYIVAKGKDGTKTALYTGTWQKPENITAVESQKSGEAEKAKAEAELQAQLKALADQLEKLKKENDQLKQAASSQTASVSAPAGSLDPTAALSTPVKNLAPPRKTGFVGGVISESTTAPSASGTSGTSGRKKYKVINDSGLIQE